MCSANSLPTPHVLPAKAGISLAMRRDPVAGPQLSLG
jgi:hypothetical protein